MAGPVWRTTTSKATDGVDTAGADFSHPAVIQQLFNLAMTGNIPAARLVLVHHQHAQEKDVLSAAQQGIALEKFNDMSKCSDEELQRLYDFLVEQEKKGKGRGPSTK